MLSEQTHATRGLRAPTVELRPGACSSQAGARMPGASNLAGGCARMSMGTIASVTSLIWVLVQPLEQPGEWGWQIVGAAETQEACERLPLHQLKPTTTLCVEIPE